MLAALALSAAIGSASASAATVLCDSPVSPCPAGEIEPAGTYLAFGNGELRVVNSGYIKYVDVRCDQYVLASKTTAQSGSPLPAEGHGSIYHCESALNAESQCTASVNNTTDSLSYFLGMGVVKKGTAEAPLSITVNCQGPGSFSQQCTFSATAPVELGVTDSPEEGYKAATANPGPTLTRTAGSLCGSSATLTIDAYLAEESWISAS